MKNLTYVFLATLIGLLAGCGQLITPVPDITPEITLSATATALHTVTLPATSTPAPATPAATATPTTTSTPIVYVVQPGDTLLYIAIQFDINADAIQEANGIVDPRRLQVGQQLIIPEPEQDPESPPTATPTPPPLNVQALNFIETPAGSLWAVGEVHNPGPDVISEVVVDVSLLDGEGLLLASERVPLQLDVVVPGGSVSFAALFPDPPDEFAQYQAVVLTGVPLAPQTRYYLDFSTDSVSGQTKGADSFEVSGQLHNVGANDAENLRVLVTGYDEQGQIVAVRQGELAASVLRASAATPFDVDLTVLGHPVVTYSVQVQGLRVE